MEREWILVMDSGIGGLWTLNKIKKILPNENYLYFMDTLHSPYGNKSIKKLKNIAYANIKKIIDFYNIKLIVLACNTLSSVCYEYLTQKFKVPIIKIEPFFEPTEFQNNNTLVLATKSTIKHNQNLKKYFGYANIYLFGFGTLAKIIDNSKGDYKTLQNYLNKELSKFKDKNIKNIVLGCTHFNYIKHELQNIFGKVEFFENSENIAKIVKKTLKNHKKLQNNSKIISKKQKKGEFLLLQKI